MKEFHGLSFAEVETSRATHGTNTLTRRKRRGFMRTFFSNFGDPMLKILLIALGINCVFIFNQRNYLETMGIAAAILIAVIVSTISEQGSAAAFEKLRSASQNIAVRVRRAGATLTLPIADVVVGDIVLLGAGDKIPADGVILNGSLEVDQSALNGETKEAKKLPHASPSAARTAPHALQASCPQKSPDFLSPLHLFSGTVVTGGEAVMRVTAVGDKTVYGALAAELQESTPPSPLKIKLERLAKMISLIGYIGAAFVAIAYLFNIFILQNGLAQAQNFSFVFGHLLAAATLVVSVIVMAVPEGLPMMITVVLSANMKHMLKDNVLVRKIGGIETAGSLNILFTDKTGTLTNGKLEVVHLIDPAGTMHSVATSGAILPQHSDVVKVPSTPPLTHQDVNLNPLSGKGVALAQASDGVCVFRRLLGTALRYNTAAEMSNNRAIGGNSTDRILLEFAQTLPYEPNLIKTRTTPFDSAKKFMSTTLADGRTLYKGAQEVILPRCTQVINADGTTSPLALAPLAHTINELTQKAFRLIAVAVDNIFIALVAIRDQVRPEAAGGITRLTSAGIQTVMITGDARETAIAVAREVGILSNEKFLCCKSSFENSPPLWRGAERSEAGWFVLTSDELAALTDEHLARILPHLRVVARALPSDKSRLVRIAQSLNLVTGMTGDGVNDAPALKRADVGFAMGSGTEVAKEAGDVIILDDNISSIGRAVAYGRTIFKSIRKFLIFKLTINFCAMAVSIIAPFVNISTPITVLQMLWINIVMDTLAGLAYGGEKPRASYMREPPKRRDEAIINKYMWQQIITASIFMSLISLWFLKSPLIQTTLSTRGAAYAMTAFFAFFMFINIFNSFNSRTHDLNPISYLSLNKPFIWIMGTVTIAQIILIYFGGEIFRTVPLSPAHFILILALAATIFPADILRKLLTAKYSKTQTTT